MLHLFPSTAIMHTADHIRSVIKGNYSTCCASVASVDFSFVDASVGVVNTATSAPQYQRFFQNNSSRFCQMLRDATHHVRLRHSGNSWEWE